MKLQYGIWCAFSSLLVIVPAYILPWYYISTDAHDEQTGEKDDADIRYYWTYMYVIISGVEKRVCIMLNTLKGQWIL